MTSKFLLLTVSLMMKGFFCLGLISLFFQAHSQETLKVRPSPLAIAVVRYKDTYVKIAYGQPQKKQREIFGNVVPFGQVWRTGANEATEITLTRDIKVNGSDLKAGTYSVFSIPAPDKWVIIFNAELGLWGAYNYNDKMDVLRIEAPVTTLTDVVYEPFTILFDQRNDKADLIFAWDKTKVSVPLQFFEPKQ